MKKKTTHCSNCCSCPRGAHRNRVDCPGAQALKPGRLGHNASGCMARCRICGVDGHSNIRCPSILATKRGAKRTISSTHKSDGRSCRGRSAPLLQAQVDTWRELREYEVRWRKSFLGIYNSGVEGDWVIFRKAPLQLWNSLPAKWRKLSTTERRVRKRAKYSGISLEKAKARDGARAASDCRKVSERVSLS